MQHNIQLYIHTQDIDGRKQVHFIFNSINQRHGRGRLQASQISIGSEFSMWAEMMSDWNDGQPQYTLLNTRRNTLKFGPFGVCQFWFKFKSCFSVCVFTIIIIIIIIIIVFFWMTDLTLKCLKKSGCWIMEVVYSDSLPQELR